MVANIVSPHIPALDFGENKGKSRAAYYVVEQGAIRWLFELTSV
jgi:hypothetical protein